MLDTGSLPLQEFPSLASATTSMAAAAKAEAVDEVTAYDGIWATTLAAWRWD